MKRDREDNDQPDEAMTVPKMAHLPEVTILKNLEKDLMETNNQSIDQQLAETQKHYFTMYMEKLMQEIPMGKAIVESVQKNGHGGDFVYMYTASKTIVQSIMSVNKHKALKSMMDMAANIMCRYMHDKVVSPMLSSTIHEEHLKIAFEAYQKNMTREENETELEMRCLLHTIHQVLEEDQHAIRLVNPFQVQMTQQMKAISEYVVTLLTYLSTATPRPNTVKITTPSTVVVTPVTARPSTAGTFEPTPSTVGFSFEPTPSTVGFSFEPTPSTAGTFEPAPTTTGTFEPTPTTTDTFEPTPTATGTFELTPSTTDTFEPTPITTDTFEPTPITTDTFESTPSITDTFDTNFKATAFTADTFTPLTLPLRSTSNSKQKKNKTSKNAIR